MSKKKSRYLIDYNSAVKWLNCDLVMINDTIFEIDPDYMDPCNGDEDDPLDIFQRFITNFNDDEVKWMNKTFPNVLFSYSEKLGLWILCVDHYGTAWEYVWTSCELPIEVLPDKWDTENISKRDTARHYTTRFKKIHIG